MKYIIGNQKNYLNKEEALDFANSINNIKTSNIILIAPSYIYFSFFNTRLLASQNVSCTDDVPYTGEITSKQLKEFTINYCIVGHSERRLKAKESNECINKKIKLLLDKNINPILCIGESYEDKESLNTKNVLIKDIEECFNSIDKNLLKNIIIAYEPYWAISDGIHPVITPTNEIIDETLSFIKNYVLEKYGIRISTLYGGSVNSKNIDLLNQIKSCDGYLIGGSSKNYNEFKIIIDKCE